MRGVSERCLLEFLENIGTRYPQIRLRFILLLLLCLLAPILRVLHFLTLFVGDCCVGEVVLRFLYWFYLYSGRFFANQCLHIFHFLFEASNGGGVFFGGVVGCLVGVDGGLFVMVGDVDGGFMLVVGELPGGARIWGRLCLGVVDVDGVGVNLGVRSHEGIK